MAKAKSPRHGSMAVWPRKRSKRVSPRVRSWLTTKDTKLLGFPGYKVGMTHLIITDNKPTSMTKGKDISVPATIIECPPVKIASVNFYKKTTNQTLTLSSTILNQKLDKELKRKISIPKQSRKKLEDFKPEEYNDIRILVYTQPKLTTLGKKKPEIIELALGGNIQNKYNWVKENFQKEITVKDVLKEGEQYDARAITKGKGFQGPVKRFGVAIRQHKSEKTKRGPGSLGGWRGQGRLMYRVAHAGQMGYHQRFEFNKWLIKIGEKPEEVQPKGGFKHYGIVKNNYLLVKGSVQGTQKRLIILTNPMRPDNKVPKEGPQIIYINK